MEKQNKNRVSVGNTVFYKPTDSNKVKSAKVDCIEIFRRVNSDIRKLSLTCNLNLHKKVILIFDNNDWCYKEQIVDIKYN